MTDRVEIDSSALQRDVRKAIRKVESIKPKLERSILRKAMRAANAPVVKALRNNATRGETRRLRRTMGQQVTTETGGGTTRVAGVSGQSRRKAKKMGAVHIHLVDQDTKPHVIPNAAFTNQAGELIRGDLEHPGTTGDQFVEVAQKRSQAESLKQFAAKAAKEIDKEMAKKV